jgi:2-deoxystreptamine N-acetyl-D-glucosaminyltransferase/2-deoxystreptamine glucosyltransferase
VHYLKRLFGVPVVLTIHCSRLSVYRPMSRFDELQHKMAQSAEIRAARRASKVISLTTGTRAAIQNRTGLSDDKICVIPDTIEPDQFRSLVDPAKAPELRERFGLRSRNPVVAYVGRIAHEKGWKHLIPVAKALAHLRPRFLVIGDGPQRERMERDLQSAGVREMFAITGFLPNREVPSLLALADLVVMPSVHEEFGGTALEAFSLDRPVAGFEVGGLRHILGSTMPELMAAPEDSDGLAHQVLKVLQNPDHFRDVGLKACEWVRRSYSSSRVLPYLLELYQSLVEEGIRSMSRSDEPSREHMPATE